MRGCILLCAIFVVAPSAAAQSPSRLAAERLDSPARAGDVVRRIDRNTLTLDLGVIGATLGYARQVGSARSIGGSIGVGGDFLNYMVVGGRHFAQGYAYEEKDGYTNKLLFEMVHLSGFVRHQPSERWTLDTGLRASGFLHFDSSDDDPAGGYFLGGYAAALYGWRRIKLGPRLLVGAFTEGAGVTEFGINIAPLTGRIEFGW